MMDNAKKISSKILLSSVLDTKDEADERLEKCYNIVHGLIIGLSERETNDVLQAHVCKGDRQHDEVQFGLLFMILTDPKSAAKCYRDMTFVSRDGLSKVVTLTNQIVYEKWIKLQDTPRKQILWVAKEFAKNNVIGADFVCQHLCRQIAGGDVSPKNIWLTETVLDIFMENRSWLDKAPGLPSIALYTFLRVIVDHGAPTYSALRQREVEFCVSLMREKWNECQIIGRDLARLLQNIARIPEIERVWKDIIYNPNTLSPTFSGLDQLLHTRTPRRYFTSRLTPDMENKLVFLTSKVKFGQQRRYQDWFQRQYLSTPESQSLRCDLIRYICAVIHPSNEVLCSDIIPRWAVIGWLLTTCTSNVAASNAKLSLFYDWLLFDPEKDSIMNIEPCILVMFHSMRPHPAITATLLDFMCRIMTNFYPPMNTQIRQGIFTSLRCIQEKRVLQSLSPLFDNAKLDKELRATIRENFLEFCHQDIVKEEGPPGDGGQEPSTNGNTPVSEAGGLGGMDERATTPPLSLVPEMDPPNHITERPGLVVDVSHFSEEEDDMPISKLKHEMKFKPIVDLDLLPARQTAPPVDIREHLAQLDGEIKSCVMDLQSENNDEFQCQIVDRLMQAIIQEDDFDSDIATALAHCLCGLMQVQFDSTLLPQDMDEESIEDSIGKPLFVIFRNLCGMSEEDPSRQPVVMLLEEMYSLQPRLGYHFLYFLKVSKVQHDEKMSAYKDLCKNMESRDLKTCLMADLRVCQEDDVRLFTYLVPDIYTQFPNIAIGNADLLHLIVSCIDSIQLQDLICEILQGHLIMFRKDSFLSVLNASLEWETIEQYFLWQLIAAHNIPVEHIMPVLPKIDFQTHAEALTSIMIQLKQECPSADLLRPLLCRECKKTDLFTVSVLKYWAQEYEEKLADLLLSQLSKCNTPSRKRHRQPGQGGGAKMKGEKEQPTMEQILAHLDHMRQTCRNIQFLNTEAMQAALQQLQTSCSDAQKAKYGDLLALAEDLEDMQPTRVLRAVPSRRASQVASARLGTSGQGSGGGTKGKKGLLDDSDSEDESSSDEDIVRPPKSKKARKAAPSVFDDD